MTQLSAAAIASRKITIYSSQGKNNNTIEFTGSTWKELKGELRKNGYNIDEMTAIESINRHELSVDNAVVPEQDFYLHLFPVETKSGAGKSVLPTKKALMEEVKSITEADPAAKEFFKGYTKLSGEEINAELKKWNKKAAAKAKKATAPKAAAKSATKAPAKKAAAKKATATELLATAPVPSVSVAERDPRDVQAEYGNLRNELSRTYAGKHHRVRG